jgi:hypothetical protein
MKRVLKSLIVAIAIVFAMSSCAGCEDSADVTVEMERM